MFTSKTDIKKGKHLSAARHALSLTKVEGTTPTTKNSAQKLTQ